MRKLFINYIHTYPTVMASSLPQRLVYRLEMCVKQKNNNYYIYYVSKINLIFFSYKKNTIKHKTQFDVVEIIMTFMKNS